MMSDSTLRQTANQIEKLKLQFSQQDGLPFGDVLSSDSVIKAVEEEVGSFRERIFSPIVTLSGFVCQVLSTDHSCREVVSKIRADLIAQGQQPCSPSTGSYCEARSRLPEKLV